MDVASETIVIGINCLKGDFEMLAFVRDQEESLLFLESMRS
jgi:hypothetical protein